MNKKDYVKFLLPLVAVVVIIESVVLLTGLEQRQVEVKEMSEGRTLVLVPEEEAKEPVLALSFATETRKMRVGEVYRVEVNVAGLEAVGLDSVELYVSYDPETVAVDNLTFSADLPKPVFSKVSEKQKVVVVNYLVIEDGGFEVSEGGVVALMSFEVEPLRPGVFDLGFATGEEGQASVTMFVESGTGKVVPFSVNKLNVEVE